MSETAVATTGMQDLSTRDERRMIGPRAVALRDIAEVERFATLVHKSTLVPDQYRNKLPDVIGVIMFGLELGLNPMQSLQNIAWVNGKPTVYGDMMLALVEVSGLLEDFIETEPDEALRMGKGQCTVQRRGRQPITRSFTKEDASTAKLWGKAGPWSQFPGRMLQMRARSWALRDAFSDVLKGLMAREEAQDIIDVTPVAPIVQASEPVDEQAEMHAFLLEQIMATLKQVAPSASAEDREHRLHLLSEAFSVSGWSQLKPMSVTQLEAGYQHLKELVTAEEIHDAEEISETDVPLTPGPDLDPLPPKEGVHVVEPVSLLRGTSHREGSLQPEIRENRQDLSSAEQRERRAEENRAELPGVQPSAAGVGAEYDGGETTRPESKTQAQVQEIFGDSRLGGRRNSGAEAETQVIRARGHQNQGQDHAPSSVDANHALREARLTTSQPDALKGHSDDSSVTQLAEDECPTVEVDEDKRVRRSYVELLVNHADRYGQKGLLRLVKGSDPFWTAEKYQRAWGEVNEAAKARVKG